METDHQIGQRVMNELQCTTYEDLYEVLDFDGLYEILGNKFKTLFDSTTLTFIRKCYPDWTSMCSWKFKSPLKHQWDDIANRKFALSYVGQQEKWTTREDYYKISNKILNKYLKSGFTSRYNGRIYDILMDLLPPSDPTDKLADDYWLPWRIGEQEHQEGTRKGCRSTPKDVFSVKENCVWLIKVICKKENYTIPDDLPKLSRWNFKTYNGMGMLVGKYNTSVIRCLHDLFPEYIDSHLQWYRFSVKPRNSFKNNTEECIRAMKYLREMKGWSTPDDFYNLSIGDFVEEGLGGLIYHRKKGSNTTFAKSIVELNPDMTFDITKFNGYKTESLVQRVLSEAMIEYVAHYTIFKSSWGSVFQMDIYIPSTKQMLEIDGNQHFPGMLECFQRIGFDLILRRDTFKAQEAMRQGYSVLRLVQMECWNGGAEWIRQHILPRIQRREKPEVEFLETTDEYRGIYNLHRQMLETDIREDDIHLNSQRV